MEGDMRDIIGEMGGGMRDVIGEMGWDMRDVIGEIGWGDMRGTDHLPEIGPAGLPFLAPPPPSIKAGR